MTIIIEQILLGVAAGFLTGVGAAVKFLKQKAANISDEEIEQLMTLILTAVQDGQIDRTEVVALVKAILQFAKD